MVDVYGNFASKYTVRPMDASWVTPFVTQPTCGRRQAENVWPVPLKHNPSEAIRCLQDAWYNERRPFFVGAGGPRFKE